MFNSNLCKWTHIDIVLSVEINIPIFVAVVCIHQVPIPEDKAPSSQIEDEKPGDERSFRLFPSKEEMFPRSG